jgi:hypothetical protein
MIYFVIILGIIENENHLRRSNKYLYILTGFIYYVRVLFVEYIWPATTRGEQTTKDIDRFLELQKKYLVVGNYNLYSFLIKILEYNKIINI